VAAAEALPRVLDDRVDELRVTLPWGSLLSGALGPAPWFLDTMRRVLRPDGEAVFLLSVTPRDGIEVIPALQGTALTELAMRYQEAGWRVVEARAATSEDVGRSGSSWAKRLGLPYRRPAAVLRLRPPQASRAAE
jgi:hypothetical protein